MILAWARKDGKRASGRGLWAALLLAGAAVFSMAGWADGRPATNTIPAEFPPKIPDSANPFAVTDASKLPVPLAPANDHPKLECEMRNIIFDGIGTVEMSFVGPDFQWDVEPFSSWYRAPVGAGEQVAFTNADNPKARVAFALYKAHDWLPDFSAGTLERYVAAARMQNAKTFVLETPFPDGQSGAAGGSFHSFNFVRVDYYFMPASGKVKDAMEYNDYFIDLNGEYVLQMRISGPLGWPQALRSGVEFNLRRSVRKKGGLGLEQAEGKGSNTSAPPAATPSPGGSAG